MEKFNYGRFTEINFGRIDNFFVGSDILSIIFLANEQHIAV